jgi:hypothetical protein
MATVRPETQSSSRWSRAYAWGRSKLWAAGAAIGGGLKAVVKAPVDLIRWIRGAPLKLRYFEDVLPFELAAVNRRRGESRKVTPLEPATPEARAMFDRVNDGVTGGPTADPLKPQAAKMVHRPIPCTAIGLALSGGGIRSAAVCLGAIQALEHNERLCSIDYLSTVSGGGYIGCCLSTALSQEGGREFPFAGDVSDTPAVSHLRNFSNYLMPRGRSGLYNVADIVALVCRGLLANLVIVLALLLAAALITYVAFPDETSLDRGSFLPAALDAILPDWLPVAQWIGGSPFSATFWLLGIFGGILLFWAMLRSVDRARLIPPAVFDWFTSDTRGSLLKAARAAFFALVIVAFLDLQPIAIRWFESVHLTQADESGGFGIATIVALVGTVTALGGRLGKFLETTSRMRGWATLLRRALAKALILVVALIVPALVWLSYLGLCVWAIYHQDAGIFGGSVPVAVRNMLSGYAPILPFYLLLFAALLPVIAILTANGYTLHRFYRDRLSQAFLFRAGAQSLGEPRQLDRLRLSQLRSTIGPYPIINAALNVQGSAEANKRGRNAEFFTFTPDFVGSNLTMYTPTSHHIDGKGAISMETVDRRLDLATAMAISGAAISANMGRSTMRAMSPTLALLNVRLGYWLRNPRHVAAEPRGPLLSGLRTLINSMTDKTYLFSEMLNRLNETKRDIYLTDGGHIENLGMYELLKRGCQLIVVVDAEADPNFSFESLLRVEQFARIDLGIRIVLPWEEIARCGLRSNELIGNRKCPRDHGPHAAVGRIIYPNNSEGLLLYFKASVTGDEKDYVLDYKLRNPDFPHETTGDQFFSEEQFEMHRALGFHMVQGFFNDDGFSYLEHDPTGYSDLEEAREAIKALLPKGTWPRAEGVNAPPPVPPTQP